MNSTASPRPISILLAQLPVPQLTFGRRTGNIPLAAACLCQAWAPAHSGDSPAVTVLPQACATYLGDAALVERIGAMAPEVVGFTTYSWNLDRTIHLAHSLKERYGPKALLGGPEITPDNPRLEGAKTSVDLFVCGEGEGLSREALFREALSPALIGGRETLDRTAQWVTTEPDAGFRHRPSPYLQGLLDPALDDMVLLETQRGCPHRCGYCFYGKGRRRIHLAEEAHVLAAARWAHDRGIGELYLLDPSLDARPGLKALLAKVAAINTDGSMKLHSEIRAEAVDASLAQALADAGFRSLEIGLQSTNPVALERTGRRLDLARFLAGTRHLTARGIACSIDLIVGLPGDTPADFRRSVDLVADHGLADHLQVFPLAVLPGTRFRTESRPLGLHYDPAPPYLLNRSETFSGEEIEAALDYAESRCGLALYPRPDLDIAWRHGQGGDLETVIGGQPYIQKLILSPDGDDAATLHRKAIRLTHPYQIFVDDRIPDPATVERALTLLTRANPHTPLELILLAPRFTVAVHRLLDAARLARPHYLDRDLRYADGPPGNRAMVITLVSPRRERLIRGPMCRQVLWWSRGHLPEKRQMAAPEAAELDGLLVGGGVGPEAIAAWQRAQAPRADDLPAICFETVAHQKDWLTLTAQGGDTETL